MLFRFFHTVRLLDRWLLCGLAALLGIGLANLATVPETPHLLLKQIAFTIIGLILLVVFAQIDYRVFRSLPAVTIAVWGTGILLLALTVFAGETTRGVRNWLYVGPISIGPIEIVKVGALLMLAQYFAREHRRLVFLQRVAISSFIVLVPIGLTFLQPDFGSAAILAMVWFGAVLILRIPLKTTAIIVLLAIFAGTFAWGAVLHGYQKERITAFFHPEEKLLGAAYQSHQAVIAAGAGGIFGRGFLSADLISRLSFLPESSTDFAFSAIAEKAGFLGVIVVLSAFLVLFWRVSRTAIHATNNFSCAYAIGLLLLLVSESSLHIGMNLGLLPVSGLPLPFVSYGGSHLLLSFIALGILESVRLHQPSFGFVHYSED